MKKSLSIFIVVAFLLDLGGEYVWFRILQSNIQQEIQHEIEKGLTLHDITLIVIPVERKSELIWIKPGREFRYHDEMYDVIRMSRKERKEYYYCIRDSREKKLISDFGKRKSSKSDNEKLIKGIFNFHYTSTRILLKTELPSTGFSFVPYRVFYTSRAADINSPPPETII